MSKYLLVGFGFSVVLNLLATFIAVREYRAVGVAEQVCNTRIATILQSQSAAAQAEQHEADQANLAAMEAELRRLRADADGATARANATQARLRREQEVLRHVMSVSPAGCLHQPVPAALLDSLHPGTAHSASPPGGGHPLP